jgi:hypothetical protein
MSIEALTPIPLREEGCGFGLERCREMDLILFTVCSISRHYTGHSLALFSKRDLGEISDHILNKI